MWYRITGTAVLASETADADVDRHRRGMCRGGAVTGRSTRCGGGVSRRPGVVEPTFRHRTGRCEPRQQRLTHTRSNQHAERSPDTGDRRGGHGRWLRETRRRPGRAARATRSTDDSAPRSAPGILNRRVRSGLLQCLTVLLPAAPTLPGRSCVRRSERLVGFARTTTERTVRGRPRCWLRAA